MSGPPEFATARACIEQTANREISVLEGIDRTLARIKRLDPVLQAFLHVDEDGSRRAAHTIDQRLAAGDSPGPLTGLPIAVKDNIGVAGMPLTCGSRLLEGYRPRHEATAVARLRRAGAIIVGKTNLDEFAMGSSTENSAFQVTRNPWDPGRSPGGSSGGSAAAVAAGLVPVALGSDTGGSIRQPASLCGLAGIKPSYGRVSRWGLVAHASSLDQIGPLASNLEDAWLVLQALTGPDVMDPTTLPAGLPRNLPVSTELADLAIGRPCEWLSGRIDSAVADVLDGAFSRLGDAGARIVDQSLPHNEVAISAYYIISSAEASSNLARFDGLRYGRRAAGAGWPEAIANTRARFLGPEVKRRIMMGTFVLSRGYHERFYLNASRIRRQLCADFDRLFESVDVLVGPVSPTAAFPLGEKLADPMEMYLCDLFTVAISLAGLPAVTVPWGFTAAGLPVGLQVVAPSGRDDLAVKCGIACERLAPGSHCRPPLERLGNQEP